MIEEGRQVRVSKLFLLGAEDFSDQIGVLSFFTLGLHVVMENITAGLSNRDLPTCILLNKPFLNKVYLHKKSISDLIPSALHPIALLWLKKTYVNPSTNNQ